MHKGYISAAAVLAALAVALGAFGAHGLKKIVPPETVATFQTGVQYQMYHALALLAVAVVFDKFPGKLMNRSAICFITGIILFSGSLYLPTVFKATETIGLQGIGAVTPVGGLLFIAGWLFLFFGAMKKQN
jgi:uncharacterized membrane protein YgdD (TMEM256/DUF423 family)